MDIDLNADLGEGCGQDAELMPLLTSANIACGRHAGDRMTMLESIRLALMHGVQIGAHPGYADRQNFGRIEQDLSPTEIEQLCMEQCQELIALAATAGARVAYVKPHGALYNQACRDVRLAEPIAQIARRLGLALVGLPQSALASAARRAQVRFVPEGFADRRYRPDGSLVPRSEPDAFVLDPEEAADQARALVASGRIETLCVHGDNPAALQFLRRLREGLAAAGVAFRPFSAP